MEDNQVHIDTFFLLVCRFSPSSFVFRTKHKPRKENTMKTQIFRISILLLASVAVHASHAIEAGSVDSTAAFTRLKTLVGEWRADSGMGKTHVEYELIAGGNTLLERETVEKMPPMLTVYHMDGERLLLTHYCVAGNQPRMR